MIPNFGPIAIVGCGVMGIGIAATAVGHGLDVILIEADEGTRNSVETRLSTALRHARILSTLPNLEEPGRVHIHDSIGLLADCQIVIEAVNENIAIKLDVLSRIDRSVSPGTPLVTNTSSIPIDILASNLPNPECLIGAHFMNPAYLIKMVEVIRGPRTADATLLTTKRALSSMDRSAIVVRDSPGFVTSRLLHSMINDAARLVEEQVATADQIDRLMQGCLGHPTGPLRTADLIGLDNLVDSLNTLFERTSDDRYQPCLILRNLVAQGYLGQKSGKGFYEY